MLTLPGKYFAAAAQMASATHLLLEYPMEPASRGSVDISSAVLDAFLELRTLAVLEQKLNWTAFEHESVRLRKWCMPKICSSTNDLSGREKFTAHAAYSS